MADQRLFDTIVRDYFETSYRLQPVEATWLGVHTYDDQLGDFTDDGFEERAAVAREFQARLAGVQPDVLAPAERVDYALLQSDMATTLLFVEEIAHWRKDPNLYAEYPLMGVFLLATRDFAPLEQRLQRALGRLRAVPQVLAAGRQNVANPPAVFCHVAAQTAAGGAAFLRGLVPQLARQVREDLRQAVLEASETAAQAYEAYRDWVQQDLLPVAGGDFAIGRERFNTLLRVQHHLTLNADDLEAVGRRLFAETRAALDRLAERIAPGRPWRDLVEEAKADHPRAGELLDAYRAELDRLKTFLRDRDLVTVPDYAEDLEVVETPTFQRGLVPYAAYMAPAPFEARQRGQFWVTPVDPHAPPEAQERQLREHSTFSYPITALHEAYPGHHLQLTIANQVPSFVRKHVHSSLFAEGWAFYCEALMAEQGYFPDPRHLLFQLKDQLWRAARVVIDVGLHTGAMDVETGVRILVDDVALEEEQARAEVRRYAASPTQPSSYAVGKDLILALRGEFSGLGLRAFHDALLASGTIPLPLVRGEMARHLAEAT